jgi:hypothetical protein
MKKIYKKVLREKKDIEDRKKRIQEDLAAPIIIKDVVTLDIVSTYNPGSNNNNNNKEKVIKFNKLVIIIYISSLYYLLSSYTYFIYIAF